MSVARWLLAFSMWLVLSAPPLAWAQSVRLSMSASSSRVQVGEPFMLEIRAEIEGRGDGEDVELPDFGNLEVLGRAVSRPFSFNFSLGSGGNQAQVKSEIIYNFTLRASQPGTYVIQPAVITVGGRRFASRPVTVQATGNAMPPGVGGMIPPGPAGAAPQDQNAAPPSGPLDGAKFDPDMFLRTVADKHRAYVGEQVTVTVFLYVRGGLRDNPSITREPTSEGFWTHDLLPAQRALSSVRQEVNGRYYSVYTLRRFAAFPMRAGKLQIGPATVETSSANSLFDLFNGPSPPMRRNGVPVEIEAGPLPAHPNPSLPVHVGSLSLEATLDPTSAKTGDAVTLQVTAKGQGNLRALKLSDPSIPGVEVLQPELEDQVTTDLDQVGGSRVFRWLLLPRQPGTSTVPAFAVDVLDPATGQYSTVRSEPLTLTVTGPSLGATPQAPSAAKAPETRGNDAFTPTFGPPRYQSAFLRARTPVRQAPWFPWAVLAGPACVAFALGGSWGAKKRAELVRAREGEKQGSRAASLLLDQAQAAKDGGDGQTALARVGQALKSALEARLAEPIGSLTLSALRPHLLAAGIDPMLTERIVQQLEQVELSRFAPTPKTGAELDQLLSEARAALRELESIRSGGKT